MEVTAGVTMSLRLFLQTQQSLFMVLLEIRFCLNTLLKQNMMTLICTHKNDNIFCFPIRQCLRLHLKTGSEGNPQYSLGKNHVREFVWMVVKHRTGEPGRPGFRHKPCRLLTVALGRDDLFGHLLCHL